MRVRYLLVSTFLAGGCGEILEQPPTPDTPLPDPGFAFRLELFHPLIAGPDNAQFVAVQEADTGEWRALAGDAGVYTVTIEQPRFAVAIGCRYDNGSWVRILHRTTADEAVVRDTSCAVASSQFQLTGTVLNLPADSRGRIATSGFTGTVRADGTFSLPAFAGPLDVAVFATDLAFPFDVNRIARLAPIDMQSDHDVAIDFAAQGAPPLVQPLAVAFDPANGSVRTTVHSPTSRLNFPAVAAANQYHAFPAALARPGDLTQVTVSHDRASSSIVMAVPRPLVVEMPATVAAQLAVIGDPHLQPTVTFTTTAAQLAQQTYTLDAITYPDDFETFREWTIEMTGSWVGGAASIQYTPPDLATVPGFAADLHLRAHQRLDWSLVRFEASATELADGRETRFARIDASAGEFCGNGVVENAEPCDDGNGFPDDTETCDSDCTLVECGDGYVNFDVEECDPPDGETCDASCRNVSEP